MGAFQIRIAGFGRFRAYADRGSSVPAETLRDLGLPMLSPDPWARKAPNFVTKFVLDGLFERRQELLVRLGPAQSLQDQLRGFRRVGRVLAYERRHAAQQHYTLIG